MSDAARAEARKRRILQNSQNRLQKITGKIENPIPGNGGEYDESAIESLLTRDFPDDASVFLNNESLLFNHNAIPNIFEFTDGVPEIEKPVTPSNEYFLGNSKLFVVLLAVIIQFVSILTSISFSDFFFLPLFILELSLFLLTEPAKTNSVLTTLLGFSGISPQRANLILRIGLALRKCFEDGCLYMFVYVLLNTVLKLSI